MGGNRRVLDAKEWSGLEIVVRDDPDVVVVGGGMAGVSAALAAARGGARVTLVEKEIALGGLATLGIVLVYHVLCDGRGRQVTAGIAEELLKRSVADNGASIPALTPQRNAIPECWTRASSPEERARRRYLAEFNPASCILAFEQLLLAEGVRLAYDSRFVGVAAERGRIDAVIAADKGGVFALACRSVVDATGDADVCIASREETVSRSANVRSGWFYYTSGGTLRLDKFSESFARDPSTVPPGSMGFACRDGADVTDQVVEYRKLLRSRIAELRGKEPGREVRPVMIPTVPCFRMTRRLRGMAEPTAAEAEKPCADAIGMTGDWRLPGPVYHLPYGCLVGRCPNLLTAGRCISVADDLWDAARVISVCALTGEAAGTAAALGCAKGIDPSRLDPAELRDRLRRQGVMLESGGG